MEENNRRVLEELSLQHEQELLNLENDFEQQYMSQEEQLNEKQLTIVEPSDETSYLQNKVNY